MLRRMLNVRPSKNYNDENLHVTLSLIYNGNMSLRIVDTNYNTSISTLSRKQNMNNFSRCVLMEADEETFTNRFILASNLGLNLGFSFNFT